MKFSETAVTVIIDTGIEAMRLSLHSLSCYGHVSSESIKRARESTFSRFNSYVLHMNCHDSNPFTMGFEFRNAMQI